MKLHVLYDRTGKILAAADITQAEDKSPTPVARRGQKTAAITVPAQFRRMSFFEVCTQLKVDGEGSTLVLAPSKPVRKRIAKKKR